jgi:hypothetical protein
VIPVFSVQFTGLATSRSDGMDLNDEIALGRGTRKMSSHSPDTVPLFDLSAFLTRTADFPGDRAVS